MDGRVFLYIFFFFSFIFFFLTLQQWIRQTCDSGDFCFELVYKKLSVCDFVLRWPCAVDGTLKAQTNYATTHPQTPALPPTHAASAVVLCKVLTRVYQTRWAAARFSPSIPQASPETIYLYTLRSISLPGLSTNCALLTHACTDLREVGLLFRALKERVLAVTLVRKLWQSLSSVLLYVHRYYKDC